MDSDPEQGMEVRGGHQSVDEENSSRRMSGNGTGRSAFSMSSRQSSSLSRIHSPRRQTPVPLDPENPGQWVIDHHKHGLIEELKPPTSNFLWRIFNTRNKVRRLDRRFRISFAELQRMRIRKLQCQLVEDVIQMRKNGSEPDDWETTLDHYIKALQDYDYMHKCSSQPSRDPFLVSGEYCVDKYVFDKYMPKELLTEKFGEIPSRIPWEAENSTSAPICGTRSDNQHRTWFQSFQKRVEIATIGGAFLIGPMWLMVLRSTLYTSLIATTAFVTVFGFIMALYIEDDKDVLASTAAYAAVLVVFVGTSTSNSP